MSAKTVYLRSDLQRRTAHQYIDEAPVDYVVRIEEPKKKRIQEEKYHAMIGDIAKQVQHIGRLWDQDDMKRILIDEFAEEMRLAGTPLHHDGRVIPSFDGRRIVQLGIQSRDFYVKEAAQFIEYLHAFGATHSVAWSDEARRTA